MLFNNQQFFEKLLDAFRNKTSISAPLKDLKPALVIDKDKQDKIRFSKLIKTE